MSWKSSRWGGGDGWGKTGRLKTNYRGWLEQKSGGSWGRPLSRLGDRLGNAQWGERARIRGPLEGAYEGRIRGGIRSAWGANDPAGARSVTGGWFGEAASDLISGDADGEYPDEAPDQPDPPSPQMMMGGAPPVDGLPDELDLDALRERCVEEVAALASVLVDNGNDAPHDGAIKRLDELIGPKYRRLVVEWARERSRTGRSEARSFAATVVEASMYDRRDREPFIWKIYRFVRRLFNNEQATPETEIQIRRTAAEA